MSPSLPKENGESTLRVVERNLGYALGVLAGLLLFSMMLLTFVDVFGRGLDKMSFGLMRSRPVPGGFEVTEIMLAALIFLGLPLVTADDGHVTIDLLDNIWSETQRALQRVAVDLVTLVLIAVAAWKLWQYAAKTYGYGDTTAILEIPYAPLVYLMAVMTTLTIAVMLLRLARSIGAVRRLRTASRTRQS